jgi:predicted nucleic acid-binding protein
VGSQAGAWEPGNITVDRLGPESRVTHFSECELGPPIKERPQCQLKIERIQSLPKAYPFNESAALKYGGVRAPLNKKGSQIN